MMNGQRDERRSVSAPGGSAADGGPATAAEHLERVASELADANLSGVRVIDLRREDGEGDVEMGSLVGAGSPSPAARPLPLAEIQLLPDADDDVVVVGLDPPRPQRSMPVPPARATQAEGELRPCPVCGTPTGAERCEECGALLVGLDL